MRRPLLWLAFAFGGGCIIGVDAGRAGAALALLLSLALAALAVGCPRPRWCWVAVLGASLGVGGASRALQETAEDDDPLSHWLHQREAEGPFLVRGLAASDPETRDGRLTFLTDAEAIECPGRGGVGPPGRLRVTVGGEAQRPTFRDGDRLRFWGFLSQPRANASPGRSDALEWARHQGLAATAFVKSGALLSVEGHGGVGPIREAAAAVRAFVRRQIEAEVLEGPEQALVLAMVLGVRAGIDDETAEAFRVAGTYHVLAISGAQVALLAGILLGLARLVRLPPVVTAIGISCAIAFYAVVVGGQPPVSRAAVMAVVLSLGRALDLDADLANLLGLSGLGLLAHRPSNIADPGFQLSFVATLGLLVLTPPLLRGWGRWPLRLELALAASLAAQAAVLPLIACHFHRLSPAAPLLNLAAGPASAAVLVMGLVLVAVRGVLPLLAPWAGDATWIAAHALLLSCEPVRGVPWLDWRVPAPGPLSLIVLLGGLLLLAQGRRRGCALGLAALGCLGIALGEGAPRADGRLHLTTLDVGQGDCLVLQSPRGRVFMVDPGGASAGRGDAGDRTVVPWLFQEGVHRIDTLLVTHAHLDHWAAAPSVLRSFPVGEGWEGPAPAADPGYQHLSHLLNGAGVPRRAVARGVRADLDGVQIEVLAPAPPAKRPVRAGNEQSVALLVRYGDVRFILPGDFEGSHQSSIWVRADLLKVPHHGSRAANSRGLVMGVLPRIALFSVASGGGQQDRLDAGVLKSYRDSGALVLRTDLDGTITVSTDGHRLWARLGLEGSEHRVR
jgi:competence protein ComEC